MEFPKHLFTLLIYHCSFISDIADKDGASEGHYQIALGLKGGEDVGNVFISEKTVWKFRCD